MNLRLDRFASAEDYTYGILREVGNVYPLAFTLEDEAREIKIQKETRIPAGQYEIKQRKIVSGLTKKYRKRFAWFDWHLELQDVPNFRYIYLHVGNTDDDTDACILIGSTCDLAAGKNGFIGESVEAYERIYKMITARLNSGKRVFIEILDPPSA